MACAAHEAVDHLIAGKVDGVVAGEFAVDLGMGFAELDGGIAAVVFGLFLKKFVCLIHFVPIFLL